LKKPTIKEISEYCTKRKNKIDPEQFFDYYESNGWKVGRNPMKNWEACVRNWEKRQKLSTGSQQPVNNRGAEIYKHFDEE